MTALDVDGFYATLEVAVDASPEAIRTAHRQLSKKWHPDVNKDASAPERMAKINEAFFVLSDPVRRFDYDRKQPPPPVISCSSSDIALNHRKRTIVVTVTSSADIGVVDLPNPFGIGWAATVQLKDARTLDITIAMEKNGLSGVSFLDFSVDDVNQSIRIDVSAKSPTATAKTSRRSRLLLLSHGVSTLQAIGYIICIGAMGFLSGFAGRSAVALNGTYELRNTAASLSVLTLLAAVIGLSVLALFWTHVINPYWLIKGTFVQTIATASFIVMLNFAWPTAVAVLLLVGILYRALRFWVRL